MTYIETSALDSSNVDSAFNMIVNCKYRIIEMEKIDSRFDTHF